MKSKTLILFILALLAFSCTNTYLKKGDSSPTLKLKFDYLAPMKEVRYGMGYTTDGEYLYAIYGRSEDPHFIAKSMRYNIATDKWSFFHDNTTTKRFISAEAVGDKIYVFNGFAQDNSINKKVESISLNTGETSYLNDNPSPSCYAGSAVWKDKIYVFGGSFEPSRLGEKYYSDQFYVFDPIEDRWTQLGVIPDHKQTRGEIVNGILYVFGGHVGSVHYSKQIDAYDISDSTWYYIGEMPIELSANAITKHGNFIWIVGDYNKQSLLAVFDTKTLEFYLVKSNMVGRRHAGAEIVGTKLYVYGGTTHVSTNRSLQVADISKIEKLLSERD